MVGAEVGATVGAVVGAAVGACEQQSSRCRGPGMMHTTWMFANICCGNPVRSMHACNQPSAWAASIDTACAAVAESKLAPLWVPVWVSRSRHPRPPGSLPEFDSTRPLVIHSPGALLPPVATSAWRLLRILLDVTTTLAGSSTGGAQGSPAPSPFWLAPGLARRWAQVWGLRWAPAMMAADDRLQKLKLTVRPCTLRHARNNSLTSASC